MSRSELREQLITVLLGSPTKWTGQQVTRDESFDYESARRLWRAMGFPEAPDQVAFGQTDATALEAVRAVMSKANLDERAMLQIARALGRTMSRLADWEAEALVEQLTRDVAAGRSSSRLKRAIDIAETAGDDFEHLTVYAWRRHLAAAAARIEAMGAAEDELLTYQLAVGFVDVSRFTSLSNDLDEHELGTLVEDFEDVCSDVITSGGGRVIKTLGDAVLFVADAAERGADIALRVIAQMAAAPKLPNVKVGLASGSVLTRMGDVYGPPVNLASRLTSVARSNRLLVDTITAAQLGDDFDQRTLPPRMVRGFGQVSPVMVTMKRTFRST